MPCKNTAPTATHIRSFNQTVYDFYKHFGRHDLPWRTKRSPYAVFVSEIMLQQTQVDRVIPKFQQFTKALPNFKRLAHAPQRRILELWQGLGYNRRALFLYRAAQVIDSQYKGRLPKDPDLLIGLPGIGKATAASICAFAFGQARIFIETNIRSVFIHHFFPEVMTVDDTDILAIMERAIDKNDPFKWYSALMDYGSYLKAHYPNPSRKSTNYALQSPFKGSIRQIRGEILRHLTYNKYTQAADLSKILKRDEQTLSRVSKDLVREGFISEDHRGLFLKDTIGGF
jgi:A/G-specific adenine glycosylase